MFARLYHGAGKHEQIGIQAFQFVDQRGIPAGAAVHVVIQVQDVILPGQHRRLIHRQADADVLRRVGVVQLLRPHPLQRPIAAVVDVDDDLVAVVWNFPGCCARTA